MKAAQRLKIAERRAAILDYAAAHPRATHRQIGEALGYPRRTVSNDLDAAMQEMMDRGRIAYVAAMIARNEQIIQAHLPLALAGKTRSAEIVIAADEATAKRIGLDAPIRIDITAEVRRWATELGLDPEEAVLAADEYVRSLPKAG